MTRQYLYLKLLLRNNLGIDLDQFALHDTGHCGLVCDFMGLRLSSAFQPVLRADGKVVGREALLRPALIGHGELTPDMAFNHAVEARKLVQFDRLVRTIHLLNHASGYSEHEMLFLNVHPDLLASVSDHGRTFEQILHYYSVPTSQVVIEIKESAVKDHAWLEEAVNNYRSLGYRIAVDNFGSGHGSLEKLFHPKSGHHNRLGAIAGLDWPNLRPDFVKLDGSILRQAENSPQARLVLHRLVSLFHGVGSKVVIQHIETATQLEIARNAGTDLLQGHYFGKPEPVSEARGRLCRRDRLAA